MAPTARRGVMVALVGGAFLATVPEQAQAGPAAPTLPARLLKAGDLVVGPGGTVARIAMRSARSGKQQLSITDPATGRATPLGAYPSTQPFVVLMRNVPISAVSLGAATPSPSPPVQSIDGGSP